MKTKDWKARALTAEAALNTVRWEVLDPSWMLDEWRALAPTLPPDFAPHCEKILEIKVKRMRTDLKPLQAQAAENLRMWTNLMQKVRALQDTTP